MKKILIIILLALNFLFAQTSYVLGMRNSKYAYAGIQPFRNFGMAYENSVFVQDVELQYGRIALFYVFEHFPYIAGSYAFFYGMRYNYDYYDFGAELDVAYYVHPKYLQIKGVLQPRYDSDAKKMLGFSILVKTMPFGEIGFFGGCKNLPEFRDVERRLFAGLAFETPRLKVTPEISAPISSSLAATRVSVSFIYLNQL